MQSGNARLQVRQRFGIPEIRKSQSTAAQVAFVPSTMNAHGIKP